jgi:hypothetical protein
VSGFKWRVADAANARAGADAAAVRQGLGAVSPERVEQIPALPHAVLDEKILRQSKRL